MEVTLVVKTDNGVDTFHADNLSGNISQVLSDLEEQYITSQRLFTET
jgi:hypothetical protein